ncbi:YdcH family protein [Thalassotalea euphylliae]|uniref:YdcH family protein n=1 Tax=Thalassotalea euphylliae TaxID=1655234 RepID=UPI003644935E
MLGEVHSLENDFPEYKDTIYKLLAADTEFAANNKKYNELDSEIRKLELNNAPIDDEAMQQLKHDRATLKDALYQRLASA